MQSQPARWLFRAVLHLGEVLPQTSLPAFWTAPPAPCRMANEGLGPALQEEQHRWAGGEALVLLTPEFIVLLLAVVLPVLC